jgi:hypothetical protein
MKRLTYYVKIFKFPRCADMREKTNPKLEDREVFTSDIRNTDNDSDIPINDYQIMNCDLLMTC